MESHPATATTTTTATATTTTDASDERNWSDIPADVLHHLLRFLDCKTDVLRLRGVCSPWRSSLSPPPTFPKLNLPPLQPNHPSPLLQEAYFFLLSPLPSNPINPNPNPKNPNPTKPKFPNLNPNSNPSADGEQRSWLARMTELESPNKWHLLNFRDTHRDYITTDPPLTASLNLLHCRVLELSRVYSLANPSTRVVREAISKKVLVGGDFTVLVLLEVECADTGGLVLWRFGDQQWTPIHGTIKPDNGDSRAYYIGDIAFHKGKFYALELRTLRIGVVDPCSNSLQLITASLVDCLHFLKLHLSLDEEFSSLYFKDTRYRFRDLHLLSSSWNGCLYLILDVVLPYPKDVDSTLFVFVLKENESKWEHVGSLGDQIFIGHDVAFSLSPGSHHLPQWMPGSICSFTWLNPRLAGYQHGIKTYFSNKSITIYNLIDYEVYLRFFHMEKRQREGEGEERRVPSCRPLLRWNPAHTSLFFPPPPWVQWRCPSRNNIEVNLFEILGYCC